MPRRVVFPDTSQIRDPHLRLELERFYRDLSQTLSAMSMATRTTPQGAVRGTTLARVETGVSGNFPPHTHEGLGEGGATLGTTASTILAAGLFNFQNGIGVGTLNTTARFANFFKEFDPGNQTSRGIRSEVGLLNYDSGGITIGHEFYTRIQTKSSGSAGFDEAVGLKTELDLEGSNTSINGIMTGLKIQIKHTDTTARDVTQIIGTRLNIVAESGKGFGDITRVEAFVMDNSLYLATGKTIAEFIQFSGPNPKVFGGNGITDHYLLKGQTPTAAITNAYGVWVAGASVRNWLEGKTGVNFQPATSSPAMFQTNCVDANTIGHIVKGAASQAADLQEWRDSSDGVLAKINAVGNPTFPKVTRSWFWWGSDSFYTNLAVTTSIGGVQPNAYTYKPFSPGAGSIQELGRLWQLPRDYVAGTTIAAKVYWSYSSSLTTGLYWDARLAVKKVGNNVALNGAYDTMNTDSLSTDRSAVHLLFVDNLSSISGSGYNPGDLLRLNFARERNSDTYTGDIRLLGVEFIYDARPEMA